MVLVVSFGARVRLGPAYGGLFGVNNSPPHALTMRGMWTSAAPPTHALKEGLWEAEELWVPGAVKPQNQSRPGGGACTQMSVPKPSLARAAGKMKGEVSCLVLNFVGYDFGGYFLLPPSHLGPICSGEAGQGKQWLVFEATVARESRGSRWKLWLGRGQVASSSTWSLVWRPGLS